MSFPPAMALMLSAPIPQVQEHPNTDGVVEKNLVLAGTMRKVTSAGQIAGGYQHTITGAVQAVTAVASLITDTEDDNEHTISGMLQAVVPGLISVALEDLPPPANTYRYWKINVTAGQPAQAGLTWCEIELRNGSGTDLTSPGGAITASSTFSGFPVSQLIDNSNTLETSCWASDFSGTWPQWVKYDFGSDVTLADLRLSPNASSRAPADFTVEGSDDGVTYDVVYTASGLTTGWSPGVFRTFTF